MHVMWLRYRNVLLTPTVSPWRVFRAHSAAYLWDVVHRCSWSSRVKKSFCWTIYANGWTIYTNGWKFAKLKNPQTFWAIWYIVRDTCSTEFQFKQANHLSNRLIIPLLELPVKFCCGLPVSFWVHSISLPYSLEVTPPPFCRLDLATSMGGGLIIE